MEGYRCSHHAFFKSLKLLRFLQSFGGSSDVMIAIFDTPMPPNNFQYSFRIRFFTFSAGDAINKLFIRYLSSSFVYEFTFYRKRLPHIRKIKISIKFLCRPNLPGFDTSMISGYYINKFRFPFLILKKRSALGEMRFFQTGITQFLPVCKNAMVFLTLP